MAVDLHTHSNWSDGSDSPTRLFELAAEKGLTSIALTDHDTLEGISEATAAADRYGVELIPGTEISCEWQRGTMHLVVLFLEPGPGPLQDRLSGLQDARNRRNEIIVERLQHLGMDIEYDDILAEAGDGSVGRPHFAAVMVRKGYVTDIRAAFDEYLANRRPAYVPRERLSPDEAIHLSLESNAVPIIAHPHTLGLDTAADFAETFAMFRQWGLVGVECIYGEYAAEEQVSYADLARRFGFIPSGGSDYHGSYKEGLELGTGRGWLDVPASVLDDLRSARPQP